ncbi:MAG: alpha/beta hydrolase, partial [Maribacter sp.]|nr:alpha/beta hydrolase [Maribacter sp.]
AIENQPIKSNIPVLLISGEYDNETPVKWAESMMNNLTNSHHLIFRGWKHTPTTNWGNQCAMQAANDFFNHPIDRPKPGCFEQIKSPVFKTK